MPAHCPHRPIDHIGFAQARLIKRLFVEISDDRCTRAAHFFCGFFSERGSGENRGNILKAEDSHSRQGEVADGS